MAQEQVCEQRDDNLFVLGFREDKVASAHIESVKLTATEVGSGRKETVAIYKPGENVKEEVFVEKRHQVLRRSGSSSSSSSSSDEEEFCEKKEYRRHKKESIKDKLKHLLPGHKKENCESVQIEKVHVEKKHGGWFGKKEDCSESVTVKRFEEIKKHRGNHC
ncbi:hypothetical protein O6H91_17G021000 [Diphasiastrum complanatum]|uniref:Uncharacterized protein n=1 Tax=Diphasiastrum complanatum TaxID=34168 RepID=A0ACC2B4T9_DIPCM|nr:hypothetical protein O6H91_Y396500 [Diphasiastrum complanatum]KAJ7524776.1 hypothetical protein O6H91_17G021000 [Diphasiastrum complanatum]